jgi:hypothetical protein
MINKMPKQETRYLGYAINVALLVFWSIFMMRVGWDRNKDGDKRPEVFFGLGGSGKEEK